jgi:hypothetical protein
METAMVDTDSIMENPTVLIVDDSLDDTALIYLETKGKQANAILQ